MSNTPRRAYRHLVTTQNEAESLQKTETSSFMEPNYRRRLNNRAKRHPSKSNNKYDNIGKNQGKTRKNNCGKTKDTDDSDGKVFMDGYEGASD